jgi:hypothetical protein
MTVHYKLSPRVSGYLVVSGVSYHGGFMDGLIEFHDAAGFSSFGAPLARNRVNTILNLKGSSYVSLDEGATGGLLDPVLGARYAPPQSFAAGTTPSKAPSNYLSPASGCCPRVVWTSACRHPPSAAVRGRPSISTAPPSGTAAGKRRHPRSAR